MKRPPKMDYAPIASRRQRDWPWVLVGVLGVPTLVFLVALAMRWAGGLG